MTYGKMVELVKIRATKEPCSESKLQVNEVTLLSVEEFEAARGLIPLLNEWWWLRSPGGNSSRAATVSSYGRVNTLGSLVNYTTYVVRPALRIKNLKSLDLQIGDQICGLAGYDWTVISDSLALCNDGIGDHCFRSDYKAEDANIYDVSDVKKYLGEWAENSLKKKKE